MFSSLTAASSISSLRLATLANALYSAGHIPCVKNTSVARSAKLRIMKIHDTYNVACQAEIRRRVVSLPALGWSVPLIRPNDA
jgi:hypothetical protein